MSGVLNRIMNNTSQGLKESKDLYKCQICRDAQMVGNDVDGWKPCTCKLKEIAHRKMLKNGLEAGKMTFENFRVTDAISKKMKEVAERYIANYPDGSMAVLGQVGSGKTHIICATMEELINRGKDVIYMPYTRLISLLRQSRYDKEYFAKTIGELESCGLLVIDDLLKGGASDTEFQEVFGIINNRYSNKKPMIISSELYMIDFINKDQGFGSRLKERCAGYTIEITKDIKKNRRLNGNK